MSRAPVAEERRVADRGGRERGAAGLGGRVPWAGSPSSWSIPVASLLFRLRYRNAERIPRRARSCSCSTTSRS